MKSVPTDSLTDIVYENIKQDILNREYAFGDKLTVRLLCEKYEVSETPVKLALNRLVTEKLVEAVPRRGIRVSEFSNEMFGQLMETRRMMENWCLPEMLEKAAGSTEYIVFVNEKREACRRVIALYHEGKVKYDQVVEADYEFHKALMKATANPVIYEIYCQLCDRLVLYCIWSRGYHNTQGFVEKMHDAIYEALIAGDKEGLSHTVNRHLSEVMTWLEPAEPDR